MKIVTIGDIHGRKNWKEIVKKNPGSKFIFIADYLDTYRSEDIDDLEAIENFQEIIDFKISNPKNVILLIGNHDAQYIFGPKFATTRRMYQFYYEISDMFKLNKNLFQMAYQKDNYLWTHAGITNGWLEESYPQLLNYGLKNDFSNLADTLNNASKDSNGLKIFDKVSSYRGGFDRFGSSIWADIQELYLDMLDNCHQITGHNKVLNVNTVGDKNTSVTFTDCLWNKTEPFIINV